MVNLQAIDRSYMILPKISGTLSCIGSGLLARHVAKKGLKDVSLTSQMLFCISIVDIISSFFAYCLSSWLAPRGSLPYSAGNSVTCNFQGFVFTFSLVYFATAYTELAAIYWLMVHRGWTHDKMKRKRIVFGFFIPPIIVAFGAAIAPLFFDFYNPTLFNCFLTEMPPGCTVIPELTCIRGEKAIVAQVAVLGYVLVGNLIVAVFICLLVYAVYRQEKKSDQYLSKGQAKNRKNTISTAWQGVRYTSAYFVTYITSYVIFGYDVAGNEGLELSEAGVYTLEYFFVIFTPLMGFFNAGVYFYPRYSAKRKQNPGLTRMACFCIILGLDRLGERLSETSKTGTSAPQEIPKSVEEQKEEEHADEGCEEHSKVSSNA